VTAAIHDLFHTVGITLGNNEKRLAWIAWQKRNTLDMEQKGPVGGWHTYGMHRMPANSMSDNVFLTRCVKKARRHIPEKQKGQVSGFAAG
jgi:hypothetical protein